MTSILATARKPPSTLDAELFDVPAVPDAGRSQAKLREGEAVPSSLTVVGLSYPLAPEKFSTTCVCLHVIRLIEMQRCHSVEC